MDNYIWKIMDIIQTMVEYDMIDKNRLDDTDYVIERVESYIEAKNFVNENFKGMF